MVTDEHYGYASDQVALAQIPEYVPVHCVATYENCPDIQLNQDHVDSLMRFLSSEPHLQQNIVSTWCLYTHSGRDYASENCQAVGKSSQLCQKISRTNEYVGKVQWDRNKVVKNTPEVRLCL